MSSNKLIIAAAGSGKTTLLVNEALKRTEGKVLITTYTQANEEEIRRKFIKINNCIPKNVVVQTWFSFLLQHGARPYQGCKTNKEITGLVLINDRSSKFISEKDTARYYFTGTGKIYSDKLSQFVVSCNNESDGAVINRLSRIYTDIFIDEVQDLAGYDLNFLQLLFNSSINTLLVGDPRQGTYSTNNSTKNAKYKKSRIVSFFDENIKIKKDDTLLTTNYRSCLPVCELSNKLYPDLQKTVSGNNQKTGHDGVFLVKKEDIKMYLSDYKPMQLRDSVKTVIEKDHQSMTFGKSKGLEFERVIIYPTSPFIKWLKNNASPLSPTSRSKFYVAVTRASFSVAIVCNQELRIEGIDSYSRTQEKSDARLSGALNSKSGIQEKWDSDSVRQRGSTLSVNDQLQLF